LISSSGLNTLNGGIGNDTLEVSSVYASILNGDDGDDTLKIHTGSNNTLDGGAGNDTLDGGAGNNTAMYSGNRSDYTITKNDTDSSYTIVDNRTHSPEGTDKVLNVQSFNFGGTVISAADLVNQAPITSPVSISTVENSAILIPIVTNYVNDPDGNVVSIDSFTGISLSWADDSSSETLINPITKKAVDLSNLSVKITTSTDGGSLYITPPAELDWMTAGQKLVATGSYTVKDSSGLTSSDSVTLNIVGSTTDKGKNLTGSNGNDLMIGVDNAEDVLQGGNGRDSLSGLGGTDVLYGGNGDDNINGGAGIDYLHGDNGNDVINGGTEGDIIFGGKGNDQLTGDVGSDHFVFESQLGSDTVTDFNLADGDKLYFVDLFTSAQQPTPENFVATYVTDTGNDLLISLPSGSIILSGVADTTGLSNAILFVMPV